MVQVHSGLSRTMTGANYLPPPIAHEGLIELKRTSHEPVSRSPHVHPFTPSMPLPSAASTSLPELIPWLAAGGKLKKARENVLQQRKTLVYWVFRSPFFSQWKCNKRTLNSTTTKISTILNLIPQMHEKTTRNCGESHDNISLMRSEVKSSEK